ncbi:non-ribosomal peptide synthetase [Streptomyces caniscabiei]|uniref:non-ribosomal peptide synthetase n=2 Tax=Streptomyces caniscabiei TaxID=2746961 RepID=UPI001F491143|nr:non-ribosomal peptide synthetase [Streptomyces caniscabiei]
MADLFAAVLGVPGVGADDDFFRLGGHSLLVARLVNRVRADLGAELSIREVFEHTTVARLAELLSGRPTKASRPPLVRRERPERVPLSAAQRRMWFLDRLDGPAHTYTIPVVLRMTGTLDHDALRDAFDDVVRRHEVLRTVIADGPDGPHQTVVDTAPHFAVRQHEPDDFAAEMARAARTPFSLHHQLPVRAELFTDGDRAHALLLLLHHIAGDGASMRPLAEDLSTAYAARLTGHAPDWAPLPVQYADYALWERELPTDRVDFWTRQLAGIPDQIDLPIDRARPAVASHRGGTVPFTVPAALRDRIEALGRDRGASAFMVLHATLVALLTRLGVGEDIVIGTPVEGRPDTALEGLVGLFANTLVLRADTSGDPTFEELLDRVRAADVAAYDHTDVPFEHLVEVLNPARSRSRHPLFQVMLTVNQEAVAPTLPGLAVTVGDVPGDRAKFDLSLTLVETAEGGWAGSVEYASDLFDRATAESVAARFARLLQEATADPARPLHALPLLTPAEREETLHHRNDTARPLPGTSLPEMFEAQAARTPHAVAVVADGAALTYDELNRRANRLARHLITRGAGPESVVAVVLPRRPEVVVALLATLKTGAAYLPIDPANPRARIDALVADAAARIVLDEETLPVALDDLPDHDQGLPVHPHQAAYLIYTSGSTGRPKGVVVEHGSLAAYLSEAAAMYPAASGESLIHTSLAFDMPVTTLFTPLITGGRVRFADLDRDTPTPDLLKVTPSHLRLLESLPDRVSDARDLVIGGEALDGTALQAWRERHPEAVVVNEYGPTEATVGCVVHRLEPGDDLGAGPVPIGRPIGNARVYVLDDRLQPVPDGVWGELYLAGAGLARGYAGRPGQSAERFVADPYGPPGTRMYRVGDRARWNRAGFLEYAGRVDDQVKIRGYRIEPGEIETALTALEGVAQASVIAREDRPGDQRLVAYVVPLGTPGQAAPLQGRGELRDQPPLTRGQQPTHSTPHTPLDPDALRTRLAATLPAHLIPSTIIEIQEIPLNPNGKLDRRRLPAPPDVAAGTGRAPRTPLEAQLCTLFAGTLDLPEVSADDDFFALGGHSLLATRLAGRIGEALGIRFSLSALLEAPTPAGLARHLTEDGPRPASWVPDSEAELSPALRFTSGASPAGPSDARQAAPDADGPREILLTGATGFVGAFLLAELLDRTSARVHCLVRARTDDEAGERLTATLRRYGIDLGPASDEARLNVVRGDLAAEDLGLGASDWADLRERVDTIVHSGAHVHHLSPYERLKPANVEGTRTLLRLAAEGRPKAFHHLSTLGVFGSGQAPRPVSEDSPIDGEQHLYGDGYAASKWVADRLVERAFERGATGAIHRLGRIWAHTATGAVSTDDMFSRLLTSCAALGCRPTGPDLEEALLPVDVLARAVVGLILTGTGTARVHHLHHPRTVGAAAFLSGYDRMRGTVCEAVPLTEWLHRLRRASEQGRDLPILPYLAYLEEHARRAPDLRRPTLAFENDRTLRRLRDLAVDIPDVDEAAISRYWDFVDR